MELRRTVILLAFMLTTSIGCYGTNHREGGLELSNPEEIFRSDGGRLEVWSPDSRALQDANLAVDRATLEPRGLALFKYSEAAQLAYVLEGQAKVGLSYPWEESPNVRTVRQGEVVAIPKGIGHWCYNDGKERTVVIRVADTRHSRERSEYEEFYLHGGSARESSSVLHGFDEELLSQAWDVSKDIVRQVTQSQKGTVIVRVREDIDIFRGVARSESEEYWNDFTYNLDQAKPDVEVRNGGTLRKVDEKCFEILREIRLSAMRVRLEKDAIMGPSYACNMDGILYVTKGSGRIQIVGSDERLLDAEVKEGSLVVIPEFHPNIIKATGREGLEFTTFGNSEKPRLSFLAGKNAVYRNIPVEVLAAGDNVEVEVEQKIRDRRQNDMVIFAPRGREGYATKLSDLFLSQFEDMKPIVEFKRGQV